MKVFRILLLLALTSTAFNHLSLAGEPELDIDHDQLKLNMDKLDSQIQELNTSLEEETEKLRQKNFDRQMEQNRINLEAYMAKQKETERKRNRWNVVRLVLLIVTVVAAIASRAKRKKAKALLESEGQSEQNQSE